MFPDYPKMIENKLKGYFKKADLDVIHDFISDAAAERSSSYWNASYDHSKGQSARQKYADLKARVLGKDVPAGGMPLSQRLEQYKRRKDLELKNLKAEALWKEMESSGDFRRYDEYAEMLGIPKVNIKMTPLEDLDF